MNHFSFLHSPSSPRSVTPPPTLWRELRDRLERLAAGSAGKRCLKVYGYVDVPESDVSCALCVVVGGELHRVRDIQENGRFRLDLPANETVRLVFIQFGFLPRVLVIRPSRKLMEEEDAPMLQRLDLRVTLTSSITMSGVRMRPVRERITLSHGHGPMLVEWDREPRPARHDDFWPLLKRAS